MDNITWALNIVEEILISCRVEVTTNVELWVTTNDLPQLPDTIINTMCPENCNDHGTCQNGTCRCASGWIGFSCNIREEDPPLLISIPDNICDIRQTDCSSITVYGTGFVNSANLTCHFTKDGSDRITPAVFVLSEEVHCRVTQCDGAMSVAISNHGLRKSAPLDFVCFDSVCNNCNSSGCMPRNDVCRIDGKCYADGFVNPEKPQEACHPLYSNHAWTLIRVDTVEETRPTFNTIIENKLVTSSGNLTIRGSLSLELNAQQRLALIFGGLGELDLGSLTHQCMRNPENCLFGFTITFSIRFQTLAENVRVLSTWCNEIDATGIKVYYSRQRLYAVVSTPSARWMVFTSKVDSREYRTYTISWSRQTGLELYVNGERDNTLEKPEMRTLTSATLTNCSLVVGHISTSTFTFALELLNIVYVQKATLDSFGITTGFPKLLNPPTLAVDFNNSDVAFQCAFEPLVEAGVQYIVRYYGDNQLLSLSVVREKAPALTEIIFAELKYGSEMFCEVVACYSSNCNATSGEAFRSPSVPFRLELQTNTLVLYEGGTPGFVNIRSRVPPILFCPFDARDGCDVSLHAGVRAAKETTCPDQRTLTQAVIAWSGAEKETPFCGVSMDVSRWSQVHSIAVKAVIDALIDNDQERTVEVWASVTSEQLKQELVFNLGQVRMTVKDEDKGAKCLSVNDPHVQTFDGITFDNFYEGEFILYRHRVWNCQVNTFYRSCNGRATCNCAVAVRVDDDVLVINKCPPRQNVDQDGYPISVTLYRNGDLTPGFRINKYDELKYAVFLPNGDVVYAQVEKRRHSSGFINVWIVASGTAFNNTEGLCGTFDGNGNNDLTMADGTLDHLTGTFANSFSLSWRVSENNSLFDGYCQVDRATATSPVYCDCAYGSAAVCGRNRDVFQCGKTDTAQQLEVEKACDKRDCKSKKSKEKIAVPDEPALNTQGASLNKGSDITDKLIKASDDSPLKCRSTEPRTAFEYNITYVHTVVNTSLTREAAKNLCDTKIRNASSTVNCAGILGPQLETYINFCVNDTLITGDDSWVLVAIENIKQMCLVTMEFDVTFWTEGTDGFPVLPPLVNLMCPNDCTSNGTCVQGKCFCFQNRTGVDCSISTLEPPVVLSVKGGELCDTLLTDCTMLVIYGKNFVDNENLTCHFTEIKNTASWTETNITTTVNATYVSSQEIQCSLPYSASFFVRISNNHVTFSQSRVKWILYSSVCETCNSTSCTPRVDVCKINNACYESGSVSPFDASLVCRSNQPSQWTLLTVRDIRVQRLTFIQILGNILQTTSFNFTVVGNPVLTSGPFGGLVLVLNGQNQWIDLTHDSSLGCLWNLEDCDVGLTLTFRIKIKEVQENSVIFTSGADLDNSYGLAMWHRGGRIYLRLSTSKKEWTVYTSSFQINTFFTVKISWNLFSGLDLFFDSTPVGHAATFVRRTRTDIVRNKEFFIGRAIGRHQFTAIEIEGFEVVYCPMETVKILNVPYVAPEFDKAPELTVTVTPGTNNVTLQCKFQMFLLKDLRYTAVWYINSSPIKNVDLPDNVSVSTLTQEEIKGVAYGDTIACGVQICYKDNCQQTAGPVRKSNDLIAQVLIREGVLDITEGEDTRYLTVSSTLPPHWLCAGQTGACSWRIKTVFRNPLRDVRCADGRDVSQALIRWVDDSNHTAFCGGELTETNWLSGVRLEVSATLDGLKDNTQTRLLELRAQTLINNVKIRDNYIGTVQVTIKDKDETAECIAHGDPHLQTFDGREYNNYLEGEFIFYKHKTDPYEVRTFFRGCSDAQQGVSCLCAVAIKVVDDVIVVDKCGAGRGETNMNRPIKVFMYTNGELTPGTSVLRLRGGKKFRVVLPTGAYVTIETTSIMSGKYLNVYMRSSPRDYGRTEGLCGLLDGNRINDLDRAVDDFNKHWRVTAEEDSLYKGFCPDVTDTSRTEQDWCVCTEKGEYCGDYAKSQTCAAAPPQRRQRRSQGNDITLDLQRTSMENPPKRCLTRQPPVVFEFDINIVPIVPSWPSPQAQQEAVTHCRTQIEAQLNIGTCGRVVSAELTATIDVCVQDLQITGQVEWAQSAFAKLMQQCLTAVEFDATLWSNATQNGTDILQPPLDILDSFLCPGNCSKNGLCVEGECQCFSGFSSDDCSVNLATPPTVYPPPDRVCDIRQSSCLQVTVYGSGFISSTNLVCYAQQLQWSANYNTFTAVNVPSLEVTATFISAQEVVCSLSTAGIYNISVSNVRQKSNASEAITYVSFDSTCNTCTLSGCRTNDGVCTIDGKCYGNGFVNLLNPEQICVNGSSAWTTITRTEISSTTYVFLTIIDSVLVTSSGNWTVFGKPKLIQGSMGQAVELDGTSQYVHLNTLANSCVFKPSTCRLGLSAVFGLKILELKEDMYIFTSGGDAVNGQGVSFYYRRGQFFFTVSTDSQEWTVSVPASVLKVNVFVSIEFSWSLQSGLELLVDGVVVASTTTYIQRRTVVVTNTYSSFYIGLSQGLPAVVYSRIVVEGWNLTFSARQIRIAVLIEKTTTTVLTTASTVVTNGTTPLLTTANVTSTARNVTYATGVSETTLSVSMPNVTYTSVAPVTTQTSNVTQSVTVSNVTLTTTAPGTTQPASTSNVTLTTTAPGTTQPASTTNVTLTTTAPGTTQPASTSNVTLTTTAPGTTQPASTSNVTLTTTAPVTTQPASTSNVTLTTTAPGTTQPASTSNVTLTTTAPGTTQPASTSNVTLTTTAPGTTQPASTSNVTLTTTAPGTTQPASTSNVTLTTTAPGTTQPASTSNVTLTTTAPGTTQPASTSNVTLTTTAPGTTQPASTSNVTLTTTAPGTTQPASTSNVTLTTTAPGTTQPASTTNVTLTTTAPGTTQPASTSNVTLTTTAPGTTQPASTSNVTLNTAVPGTTQSTTTASMSYTTPGSGSTQSPTTVTGSTPSASVSTIAPTTPSSSGQASSSMSTQGFSTVNGTVESLTTRQNTTSVGTTVPVTTQSKTISTIIGQNQTSPGTTRVQSTQNVTGMTQTIALNSTQTSQTVTNFYQSTQTFTTQPFTSQNQTTPFKTINVTTQSQPTQNVTTPLLTTQSQPSQNVTTPLLTTQSQPSQSVTTPLLTTQSQPSQNVTTPLLSTQRQTSQNLTTPLMTTQSQPSQNVTTPLLTTQRQTSQNLTTPLMTTQSQPSQNVTTPLLTTQSQTSQNVTTPLMTTQSQPSQNVTTPLLSTQRQTSQNLTTPLMTTQSQPSQNVTTPLLTTQSQPSLNVTTPLLTTQRQTSQNLTTPLMTTQSQPSQNVTTPLLTTQSQTSQNATTPILTTQRQTSQNLTTPLLTPQNQPSQNVTTPLLTTQSQPSQNVTTPLLTTQSQPSQSVTTPLLTTQTHPSQNVTASLMTTQSQPSQNVTTQLLTTQRQTSQNLTTPLLTTQSQPSQNVTTPLLTTQSQPSQSVTTPLFTTQTHPSQNVTATLMTTQSQPSQNVTTQLLTTQRQTSQNLTTQSQLSLNVTTPLPTSQSQPSQNVTAPLLTTQSQPSQNVTAPLLTTQSQSSLSATTPTLTMQTQPLQNVTTQTVTSYSQTTQFTSFNQTTHIQPSQSATSSFTTSNLTTQGQLLPNVTNLPSTAQGQSTPTILNLTTHSQPSQNVTTPFTTFNLTAQSQTTQSATAQSQTTQPATTQSQTTQPTTTQSHTTQPATTQSQTTQPATTQSQTTQPATTQSQTTQPTTAQSQTTQPTTTQSQTTQPAITQSQTTQPATTQSQTTQTATTQSQTTQPTTALGQATPSATTYNPTTLLVTALSPITPTENTLDQTTLSSIAQYDTTPSSTVPSSTTVTVQVVTTYSQTPSGTVQDTIVTQTTQSNTTQNVTLLPSTAAGLTTQIMHNTDSTAQTSTTTLSHTLQPTHSDATQSQTTQQDTTQGLTTQPATTPVPTPQSATTVTSQEVSTSAVYQTSAVTTGTTPVTTQVQETTTCTGYLSLPSSPVLQSDILSNTVRFSCQTPQAIESGSGSVYQFTWSSNGTELRTISLMGVLIDTLNSSSLQESGRKSILSSGLTCSVRVSNPQRCGDVYGPYRNSTINAVTLEIPEPTQSSFLSSETITISISFTNQKTVDYYCFLMYGQKCSVTIEAQTSHATPRKCIGGSSIQALAIKSITAAGSSETVCGTQLDTTSAQPQQLVIRPVIDNIVRTAVNVLVEIKQVDIISVTQKFSISRRSFTLTVPSSHTTVSPCTISSDPHIVTFDKIAYDVMRPGPFIVYRHKQYPFEVEGYFSTLGRGAIACGFAIRSGDDVIRVSRCNSPMATKLFLVGDLTPATKVYQEQRGDKIKVFLPIGTLVTVTKGTGNSVNLEIRPSVLDFNQTEGLCGIFNRHSSDDLTSRSGQIITRRSEPNEFSMSWREEDADSMFGGFKGTATSFSTEKFCQCERYVSPVCAAMGYVVECGVASSSLDITQRLVSDFYLLQTNRQGSTGRRRRQASDTTEVFEYDKNFSQSEIASWPTPSGINETQAQQTCQTAVRNSPAYSQCSQYSEDSYQLEVNNCVRDVQLSDSLTWAAAAVQSVQEDCGTYVVVNSSLWMDPSPTLATVPPSVDAVVASTLCPSNCNNNGVCTNGVCACNPGYGGSDCAFQVYLAPTVIPQNSDTLCKSSVYPCNLTRVYGENFIQIQANTLSCHLTPIEIGQTGIIKRGSMLKTVAISISQYEVDCPLPAASSYAIKISNDGQTLSSNEALYVVYHSDCFTCIMSNSTPSCTPQSLTCFIDQKCYTKDQTSPTDSCKVCSPSLSTTSWSPSSAQGCSTTDNGSTQYNTKTAIIAGSIAALVGVFIIIGVSVYCIRRREKNHRRSQRSRHEERLWYENMYNSSESQRAYAFSNPPRRHDYYHPTFNS